MNFDLTKICRLCLKSVTSVTELIDIFTNDENCSLPVRIMACSAIEVNQCDALPKSICTECRYGLEKFYLFRKKSKNADTKLRRHIWLVNAGMMSNVFEETDDDNEECEKSIALLAKWKKNRLTEQAVINLRSEIEEESEKILRQSQVQAVQVDSDFHELIEFDPIDEDKESASTEIEFGEYFTTPPLMGLESTVSGNNYEIHEANNYYSPIFGEAKVSGSTNVTERDKGNYLISGIDAIDGVIKISIAEAEAGSKDRKGEVDYTSPKDLKNKNSHKENVQEKKKIGDKTKNKNQHKENVEKQLIGVEPRSIDWLKDYIQAKKPMKNDLLCCEFCSKWFSNRSALSRHMRIHTGVRPFKCEECGKDFVQKEVLTRHLMIHNGNKPHRCIMCDKQFVHREHLSQHMNRHHSTNPITYLHKCPKCPKKFLHASGLSRHSPVHDNQIFECEFCSRSFRDKGSMKRHVGLLHRSKSPLPPKLVSFLEIEECST